MRFKVVVDTNVFISAILFKSRVAEILDLCKKGDIKILMSKEVLEEYIKVLAYPKFNLSAEEIRYIIEEELFPFVETINVTLNIRTIKEDRDDNKFIALGLDGEANYIISGDTHLLKLKRVHKIEIVSGNSSAFGSAPTRS